MKSALRSGFFMSSVWLSVRFRRAVGVARGFVLSGVAPSALERVCARLFVLGAEFVSCGSCRYSRFCWVCFRCSASLAGRLALVFPCEGSEPLFVSASGRLLSGAAESRARAARGGRGSLLVAVQGERGRRCWG
jgi:hypothetical protein